MKRLLVRRSAVGLALGALAATGLASVPTPASAVVTDPSVHAYGSFYDDGSADCTSVGNVTSPDSVPWSDNGVAVTSQMAKAGTISNDDNAADISDVSIASSATISASPLGIASPGTITVSGSARASAVPRLADSDCDPYAYAEADASGDFKLLQPTWVTITGTGLGDGYASINVWGQDGSVQVSAANRSTGSVTALLPAGDAGVYFDVYATAANYDATNVAARSSAFTASFKVTLEPIGNGSAVVGKGKSYVSLDSRACPSGTVAVSLTKKAKKKAKLVEIKVNGAKKGKKFQGKKLKKRTVAIAAAPAADATIVATITLKNGKKITVTRSYKAC